jgi:cytochrome c
MDSFELNKIIGAILGTLLFVMGAGFLAEAIYHPIEGRGPGYSLPEPEGEAGHGGTEEEAPVVDLGTLLASANVEQGASAVSKCKGCHNFEEGAGNKQGPVLHGVAGRQIASVAGFTYGDALAAMGAEGETWTYQHLSDFLTAPKSFAPATKMNFGGVKNDAERANIIAYLASISPGAPEFPAPAPAEGATAEAEAAAPADESTPAVETGAEAVETPTETQGESPVEGTPVTETGPSDAGAAAEPAADQPAAADPVTETVGPGATAGQ